MTLYFSCSSEANFSTKNEIKGETDIYDLDNHRCISVEIPEPDYISIFTPMTIRLILRVGDREYPIGRVVIRPGFNVLPTSMGSVATGVGFPFRLDTTYDSIKGLYAKVPLALLSQHMKVKN